MGVSFFRANSLWRQGLCLAVFFCLSGHLAYADFAFGIHTEDNDAAEITALESKYGFKSQVVGYIFDTFGENDAITLQKGMETLGKDRVYHVSISPLGLSAKEVADGKYDEEYLRFFKIVKVSGARVVFRTMHEMNGSWFSWSGDPDNFKRAWKRVHGLSRSS